MWIFILDVKWGEFCNTNTKLFFRCALNYKRTILRDCENVSYTGKDKRWEHESGLTL